MAADGTRPGTAVRPGRVGRVAVIDVAGYVAELKDHAVDHGFHVHDERHFVETYSLRQAWEVDLHPEEGCNGPLDLHLALEVDPRVLLAFEDEVVDLPDGEDPKDEYHFPLTFTWALPPLPHGPDLLRLAIDLAGVGGCRAAPRVVGDRQLRLGHRPGRAAHHHRRPPAGVAGPGAGRRGAALRDLRPGPGRQPVPAGAGAGLAERRVARNGSGGPSFTPAHPGRRTLERTPPPRLPPVPHLFSSCYPAGLKEQHGETAAHQDPPSQQGRRRLGPGRDPVPPRPPRNLGPASAAAVAAAGFYALIVGVVVAAGGGGRRGARQHVGRQLAERPNKNQAAVNYTTAAGVKVYGALGPENVPLQVGTPAGRREHRSDRRADRRRCSATRTEQLTYHHHAHLAIFINGQPRSIPLGVGMVPPALVEQTAAGDFATGSQTCLYWLHVHAQDGILHIESPTPKVYELAQFFAIWHVPLSANQIGSYKGTVTATVDGKPWTGNPGADPAQGAHPDRAQSGWPHRQPAADQLERHRPLRPPR